MIVNLWVGLSTAAQNAVKERVEWDEDTQGAYTGPVTDTTLQIFNKMHDHATVQKLFKVPNIAGKDWHLWSVYLNGSQAAANAITYLTGQYPNDFVVGGAWNYDTGAQLVSLHPQLIQFMPDEWTYDANGNPISSTPATILSDVNLLQGQAPRDLT